MLQDFKKHLMTGISYMIPMVVAGGILGALAKGLGGWEVGNLAPDASGATIFSYLNAFDWGQFWWAISKLSDFAMSFACAVLAAGIAYSMSERPGIVPAFILGYTANQAKAGFIGALILGFIVGWLVNVTIKVWRKTSKSITRLASSIDYSSICYIYCWGIVLHVIDGTYDSSYDSYSKLDYVIEWWF